MRYYFLALLLLSSLISSAHAVPNNAMCAEEAIANPYTLEMLRNGEVTDDEAMEGDPQHRCPCRSDPLKCCEFAGVADCKTCIKGACGRCCGTYNVKENNAWWRCMSTCCGGTSRVDPNKGQYGGCTD